MGNLDSQVLGFETDLSHTEEAIYPMKGNNMWMSNFPPASTIFWQNSQSPSHR